MWLEQERDRSEEHTGCRVLAVLWRSLDLDTRQRAGHSRVGVGGGMVHIWSGEITSELCWQNGRG